MTAPTARQLEVLRVIEDSRRERGFSPTIREIVEALGISSLNGAVDHLRALERKDLLDRTERTARTYRASALGLRYLSAGGAR